MKKEKRKSYKQLSLNDRYVIYKMREKGYKFREICRSIGRPETAAGSISREFKRNEVKNPILRQNSDSYELARYADEKAQERLKIPRKNYLLASDLELKKFVESQLENEEASPRDIVWRVKKELENKSISHSTIYDHTKRNRGLIQKLRRKGKKPKQRLTKRSKPKVKSVSRRNISERIWIATQALEFGHYELDTIVSPKGGSGYAILTIRELKSKQRWFFKIPDLKAETTLAVARGFFSTIPSHMLKTLLVDNGSENADLYKLEDVFRGFKVYYCDPYCSWQRGSVENANGEFRWYYPKGTDFKDVSREDIWKVQDKLNRRRMDCLNGENAAEVFQRGLKNPSLIIFAGAEALLSETALFEASGLLLPQNLNDPPPLISLSGYNSFYIGNNTPNFSLYSHL